MSCCKSGAFDISALVLLADTEIGKEAKVSEKLPEHLKKIMAERMANREKEKAERAADSIIEVLDAAENLKLAYVQAIRNARAQIAAAQRGLANIDAAIAYGNDSSNYLPLTKLVFPTITAADLSVSPELFDIPAEKKMTFVSKSKKASKK